jgi:hypothetical protein
MTKTPFLPNNSRPSTTGQGLTATQLKFLTTPKTMQQIADELFKGDYWAANHFQNRFINNAVLQINKDATIQVIDWFKIDHPDGLIMPEFKHLLK